VDLELPESGRSLPMQPLERGYYDVNIPAVAPGTRYRYGLDRQQSLPDPASRWQPEGVHASSAVLSHGFRWSDTDWTGLTAADQVIYELHVGTFTAEGTFEAVIPRLPALRELGVTAIELMPITQFPGARNWGYDGVYPFAAQNSYGGPAGLCRLVEAAHREGLGVLLDVVYNHLGPEGNYLPRFGPYFTDRYRTGWGEAVNFDGPGSDEVRAYFIASAMEWLDHFHIDGLRLDAVHAITDTSAYPFLEELTEAVRYLERRQQRRLLVIAESDLADPRLVMPTDRGGFGMDAQWQDDLHHALHTLLTGERAGYYADYGSLDQLARAYRDGFAYTGDYSPYRGRRHGRAQPRVRPEQLVVFAQNHDQVGNRAGGDRLTTLVDGEALKLAAATVLLSPFTPLLFMGEEYGEQAPFPYFVSHLDDALAQAVRAGRKREMTAFGWSAEPPDPLAEETMCRAILHWSERDRPGPDRLLRFHRDLLRVRRQRPALREYRDISVSTAHGSNGDGLLTVRRTTVADDLLLLLNFGADSHASPLPTPGWSLVLDSAHTCYGGPGAGRLETQDYVLAAYSAVLLERATI